MSLSIGSAWKVKNKQGSRFLWMYVNQRTINRMDLVMIVKVGRIRKVDQPGYFSRQRVVSFIFNSKLYEVCITTKDPATGEDFWDSKFKRLT